MIRNVVFDIGGVLVRLRYRPFIEYLAAAGIDMTDLPAWLEETFPLTDTVVYEGGQPLWPIIMGVE